MYECLCPIYLKTQLSLLFWLSDYQFIYPPLPAPAAATPFAAFFFSALLCNTTLRRQGLVFNMIWQEMAVWSNSR